MHIVTHSSCGYRWMLISCKRSLDVCVYWVVPFCPHVFWCTTAHMSPCETGHAVHFPLQSIAQNIIVKCHNVFVMSYLCEMKTYAGIKLDFQRPNVFQLWQIKKLLSFFFFFLVHLVWETDPQWFVFPWENSLWKSSPRSSCLKFQTSCKSSGPPENTTLIQATSCTSRVWICKYISFSEIMQRHECI